jgi:DNA-directed RNA polymerase specialized sigma24 family protein
MDSPPQDYGNITILLKRLSSGDGSAETELADAVYARLQIMARTVVQNGGSPVSLRATALVNDVLLELTRAQSIDWVDRGHFFRTAARLLRRRFVDYIRGQKAAKRPPNSARDELSDLWICPATR